MKNLINIPERGPTVVKRVDVVKVNAQANANSKIFFKVLRNNNFESLESSEDNRVFSS